jgi:drug/metabolite transporter (DMT)-like permease
VPATRARLAIAFASVYIIWGSTYLAIRFALETLPAFSMAGVRFLISGGVLYAIARLTGAPAPRRIEWRSAAVVGAALLLGGNGGVVLAERSVPSGMAALLVATLPLWMAGLQAAQLGRLPRGRTALGLLVGFLGVAILVGPGAGGTGVSLIGVALLLLASLSWAAGSLYSREAPLPRSSILSTAMQMLCGGVLLLVAGGATGEWAHLGDAHASTRSLLALGYLITFGALIGYTAYIWLLRNTTPARVATYAYVNPLVAVLLGWALAGESLSWRIGLAAAIIVSSVMLTIGAPARREDASSPRGSASATISGDARPDGEPERRAS